MLFNECAEGRTERLESSKHYRLFFLLKGKTHIEGSDKRLLYGKEFTLLPPDTVISCSMPEHSRYAVVNCNGLMNESNVNYLNRLKRRARLHETGTPVLPIDDKLAKLLNSFAMYSIEDNRYSSVFNALFFMLRLLYGEDEMFSLFRPLLKEEEATVASPPG